MKVVVATRNRHKVREIAVLLGEAGLGFDVVTIDDIAPDAELIEDEATFEGNALAKARQAAAACGLPGAADSLAPLRSGERKKEARSGGQAESDRRVPRR